MKQGRDIDDFPRGYEISLSDRHTDFDAVARASKPAKPRAGWSIAEVSVECH